MKKVLLLVALASALVLPGRADAHPLGNFTVNHYAGIEVSGRSVYVHFVIDLAEIPAFQLGADVRAPGYADRLARDVDLRIDGRRAQLTVLRKRVIARRGAGGLDTLRLDVVYRARGTGSLLGFVDRTFPGRVGWKEITVSARDGATIVGSSVPAESESDELRAYPEELLRSPLDVRSAQATVEPGEGPGSPPSLAAAVPPARGGGGLEALIERGELSVGIIALSLLLAAFWGAAHALTPGHGKALVAGYLVGTRGKPRHAVILGATVTITHTAGVFALGIVTLALSHFIVPEQLYPWLTFVSGLLVVLVGVSVLRLRLRAARSHDHGHRDHDHHDHDHDHHHDHHHAMTSKGILGVGVAAGLLPCPSALVVLLSAIALHRLAFGLALILAFSLGLALTITGIGLAVVLARRAFSRVSLDGPVVRALPSVSALAILAVGVVITLRAVPGIL